MSTNYETIALSTNETVTYDLSDGETFENKLIDQRASGASYAIRASDTSGWTVRNIGFLGIGDRETPDAANQHMLVSCPSGASGTVENVWMSNIPRSDDGDQQNTPMGGIYLRPSHGGHIDIRHTYIEGMGNNASYADRPGRGSGNGGTVTYENCYHRDNTVSQFRIGTSGSVVRNCIGIVDDPGLERGTYISGDSKTARGVWGWHNTDLTVENSTIVVDPDDPEGSNTFHARMHDESHGSECVLNVSDCHVNPDAPNLVEEGPGTATVNLSNISSQPTASVLGDGGVPTSPEMAASGDREYVDPFGEGGGGGGGGGTTQPQEYDVIKIGAGETFRKDLSPGEVWENKLLDITANHAEYRIHTRANNCTIRNIGVKGRWDSTTKTEPFMAYTHDPDGHVLVENFYFGDGSTTTTYPQGPTGIYVPASHRGTLTIRNMNCQHVPDNAVYGSSPGNPSEHSNPGRGGDVIIEDSFASDLQPAAWRVGTDGSRVENCVAVNTHRGGWAYFNEPLYRDCDFSNCRIADYMGGNSSWSQNGRARLENCRGGTTGGRISGSLEGPAVRTRPDQVEGVPLTAEEAASGASSGEGPGPTPSPDVGPSGGDYWGVNPNSEGDTQRIGSIEVHDRHPFGHGPE